MLLEFLLILLVLSTLFLNRSFRCWFRAVNSTEKQIGMVIILLMIIFQFVDISRTSFPFVRWAMYTESFDAGDMQWGKLQARLQDGTVVDINPTQQFPSLSRNFAERFRSIVSASKEGELTELGNQVYAELLTAIGRQYNRAHDTNPAVELIASLETITIENGKPEVQYEFVSSVSMLNRDVMQP